MKIVSRTILAAWLIWLSAGEAGAHSAERGFVLLLPTGYVIAGGALAVLASFLVVMRLPDSWFLTLAGSERRIAALPMKLRNWMSLASLILCVVLIWTGFIGSQDPLENPLPLTIWTLWWVVIVLLHPIFGNFWSWLNPFTGICALLDVTPRLRFPNRLSFVPAFGIFLAFAWFELVYPGPDDPDRLAMAVLIYMAATFAAAFTFGAGTWFAKGDPFAIFLRLLGHMAPIRRAGNSIMLQYPGAGLLKQGALPLAGILFVLLTLSSVSFDGFSNTFIWLSFIGVNPLDFPGRTAVMTENTAGLIGFFIALTLLFAAAITSGWLWAGRLKPIAELAGVLVLSLIPISIAFHFAHYLSDLLINGQYLLLSLNDPFGMGWNLLGLGHWHVTASFQNTAGGAFTIFAAQTAAIVIGHILGVAVAHMIMLRQGFSGPALLRIEAPLALLMVLYTGFGLWVLAAPAIG